MKAHALTQPQKGPDFVDEKRADEIENLTRRIFDTVPTRIAFPGGKSRSVFIAEIKGETYAFAKRGNKFDAKVESSVLKALSPSGLVPAFIARNGKWVVQQCLFGKRLPILIDEQSDLSERVTMVSDALESLYQIQQIAHRARLQSKVPRLGVVDGWIDHRIGAVDKISKLLHISPPILQRKAIKNIFDVRQTDFVKWDARPGNALVENGQYRWFDWEDCGKRCALDDLVCFISDEWTNIDAKSEVVILNEFIPKFGKRMPADKALQYFFVAGCLQLSFRLKLAVEYRTRDNKWWDREHCLKGDKVGVTASEVTRLCDRMINWAENLEILKPYADWAETVKKSLNL